MKTTLKAPVLVLTSCLMLAATGAVAQTVGDVLDKGGQRLDAAATRAIITGGVTLTGTNAAGFTGATVYKADGTVSASGSRGSVTNSGTGSWTVDDSGKVCSKISWNGGGTGGGCHFWFKEGDTYYTAGSDERSQRAIVRTPGR